MVAWGEVQQLPMSAHVKSDVVVLAAQGFLFTFNVCSINLSNMLVINILEI